MPIGLQTNKIKYDIVSAGFDPELMDAKSFIDSTLSFTENRHNVASQLGYKIGGKKDQPIRNAGRFNTYGDAGYDESGR